MNKLIKPSKSYTFVNDLWIISCIFNPASYASKRVNYNRFITPILHSRLNFVIVDCAIGDSPFNLDESENVIRVRVPYGLWQKERLLNIAISVLPASCTKVAWVDCDVLFENPDWAIQASSLLDSVEVVQLFTEAIRLPKDCDYFSGEGSRYIGFAYGSIKYPSASRHGHTGFAWAAQKKMLLENGLYDTCIAGSADHVMAHAFRGDINSLCIQKAFGTNVNHRQHFENWANNILAHVKGDFSFVDGALLHLWHGEDQNRQYTDREKALQQLKFDPYIDLQLNNYGCWMLSENRNDIREWMKAYFLYRKED